MSLWSPFPARFEYQSLKRALQVPAQGCPNWLNSSLAPSIHHFTTHATLFFSPLELELLELELRNSNVEPPATRIIPQRESLCCLVVSSIQLNV